MKKLKQQDNSKCPKRSFLLSLKRSHFQECSPAVSQVNPCGGAYFRVFLAAC